MANTAINGANALSFSFSPSFTVRVVTIDGEPWFVAKDVLFALDYSESSNPSRMVAHVPEEWRGVNPIHTPSGEQEMHVLSEQGLYFFLGRSDKPKALPFQKWLAGEVLPAIRKTGRYVAPAAQPEPPAHTAERLSNNDLRNIKRLVWIIANGFRFESAWCAGIWFYLRRALCVPAPQQYSVEHLTRIAQELQTLAAASERVHMMMIAIEKEAATRIFRRGEVADAVVADLQAKALQRLETLQTQCAQLPSYLRTDMTAVTARAPNHYDHASATEVPGYFDKQGAAA